MHTNPATAGYLSPAQAVAKEVRDTELAQGGAEPAPAVKGGVKEEKDDRILRVLMGAKVRLQGRGMPELDVELNELIADLQVEGKKKQ